MIRQQALLAALLLVAACQQASSAPRALELPDTGELTYGIYLNGSKVGWMQHVTKVGKSVELEQRMHAAVGGMGQVSTIELVETRSYDAASGQLQRLSFVQKAATGEVRVEGERQGKELVLRIGAGRGTSEQRVETTDSLADQLAMETLAKQGVIGKEVRTRHFDPSLQRTLEVRHKLTALETKMLAGVSTRVARIDTVYPEIGVNETAWLDEHGTPLETQVGGFFVARLEPPEVAKRLDYQEDLLVSAVVKPPAPLEKPEAVSRLTLTFTGFGETLPPASPRQTVLQQGDEVTLTLSRDPDLPELALGALGPVPADVLPELSATPFIQSDHDDIRAAARKAIGNATTLPRAVERMTRFVYDTVRDEYVPAYSNALEALDSRRGDCTEHSVLFVALMRSLGVPARVAVGIAYWPPGNGFGWHAWAEIYAQGRWYAVDPTWNQPIADATHIKLAGGGPAEQARIVMLLGRLKVTKMSPG